MKVDDVSNIGGWTVTLRAGAVLEIFADSFIQTGGFHSFQLLVNATDEEQAFLRINGRDPRNPSLVYLEVLRIPSEEIVTIDSGLPFIAP
jgi:hypothetical protein